MVYHRNSNTSTRVFSPLVQTMSASTGNSGSSRLCSLARMVTRLGVRSQGRLANQRASPSVHVGAVNDEAMRKDDGSKEARTNPWILLEVKRIDNLRNRSRIGINKWYQSFALRNFDLEDMEFEFAHSMLAIDGVGFDWSDMAEEQVQTNMALMAFSDSELEKVKKEKEGIEFKIEKFDKALKDLDKLLGSQISDKSKKGLGYNVVPPPHPLIYNRPKKLDLSYSGLDEFKEPKFKGYGPENREQESNVVCDKKSDSSKENSDESLVEEQINYDHYQRKGIVSRNNYNRVDYDYYAKTTHPTVHRNMTPRAVLLKTSLTSLNTVRPRAINTARSYTGQVNAVREKGVNAVKTSACWVWRPTKPNGASLAFKRHNYIDARGRSKSVMAWVLKGSCQHILCAGSFNS
ncbi:hypothetical protein Tco_0817973 [Tanacetum coccineum]